MTCVGRRLNVIWWEVCRRSCVPRSCLPWVMKTWTVSHPSRLATLRRGRIFNPYARLATLVATSADETKLSNRSESVMLFYWPYSFAISGCKIVIFFVSSPITTKNVYIHITSSLLFVQCLNFLESVPAWIHTWSEGNIHRWFYIDFRGPASHENSLQPEELMRRQRISLEE